MKTLKQINLEIQLVKEAIESNTEGIAIAKRREEAGWDSPVKSSHLEAFVEESKAYLQSLMEERKIHLESIEKTGYDALGYNEDGYDKDGFDSEGYDKDGKTKIPKSKIPYYVIAKEILMKKGNLSEEQAIKVIEESTFDEIEKQVGVQKSIEYAVKSIGETLDLDDKQISDWLDVVFGKKERVDLRAMQERWNGFVRRKSISSGRDKEGIASGVAVIAMDAVHNGWVKDNAEQFFKEKAIQREQFLYLPIEFLGWKEASKYLTFVKPIVEFLGGSCIEDLIELDLEELTIHTMHSFARVLGRPMGLKKVGEAIQVLNDYEFWTPEIKATMSDSRFVNETLLPQVKEKGFIQDDGIILALENESLLWVDDEQEEKERQEWEKEHREELEELEELKELQQKKKALQQEADVIAEAEKLIEQQKDTNPKKDTEPSIDE